MKILIVGASGLVGSNTLRYFKANNLNVVGTHYSFETNQTVYFNTLQLDQAENFDVHEFKPNVIIHCGALTHVDYCEDHVEESYEKTVQSTKNLLEIAQELNAKFVYISTDYVFDGKKGLYQEEDKTNPLSTYGHHKLEAELAVKQAKVSHLIVRVAKVFGHEKRDKNFVARLAKTIEETGEIKWKAFTDQYTTAVDAWDIAKALYLLLITDKTGVYHLGYGENMNAYDITMKVVNHFSNVNATIDQITKSDFKQTADRPQKGGLSNEKFLAEFPGFQFKTIENYLTERSAS